MPTLWHDVDIWPRHEQPRWLSAYPETASKRALSFVRNITLSLYQEPNNNYPTKDDFYELFDYVSGCLRMLKDTSAIQVMYLYDPNNHPSECNDIIESINRTTLQIQKRISKMKLQELKFHAARETTRIADIMSGIERNVDELTINGSPIIDWAPRLQSFKRLKRLEADTVPFPPRLELRFPNIVDLRLYFFENIVDYREWGHAVVTAFKLMFGLEKLRISVPIFSDPEDTHDEWRATKVETMIACTKLKDLGLSCSIPRQLVSTIARHCPHLTECYFKDDDIDDGDLRQLSISCPNLRRIHLQFADTITSFTTFQQLEILELFYRTGKFIDKSLLLKLVDSCPKLEQIMVSDYSTRRPWMTREFEDTPSEDLFAAAAELPSYFEPKISKGQTWTPDGLIEYAVRIDRLREDISQCQG